MHVFGQWRKSEYLPGENLCIHGRNTQTPHRKSPAISTLLWSNGANHPRVSINRILPYSMCQPTSIRVVEVEPKCRIYAGQVLWSQNLVWDIRLVGGEDVGLVPCRREVSGGQVSRIWSTGQNKVRQGMVIRPWLWVRTGLTVAVSTIWQRDEACSQYE